MKIKVSKEALSVGLQKVQSVINPKNPMQVLSNVLLRAGDDGLELTATDTDITVRAKVAAEVLEGGAATLPAKRLFGVVRDLAADTAEITVDAENTAKIAAGKSRFTVKGIAAEEFPALPEVGATKSYRLGQGELKGMLKLVSYAAMQDPSRPLLCSVLLNFGEGKVSAVATDSRRLALVEQELEGAEEASLVVPLKAVNELQRTLGDEGEVTIEAGDKLAAFSFGDVLLVTKLLEGKYPNYRQVIPQGTTVRATMERETLQNAVRRTSQLVIDRIAGIRLNFSPNLLEVVAADAEIGEGRETMDIKYDGPEMSISFNPEFLTQPLKALTTDEVYLDMADELSAGTFRSTVNFVYVLMPIRLS